jgi:hypothetical protein
VRFVNAVREASARLGARWWLPAALIGAGSVAVLGGGASIAVGQSVTTSPAVAVQAGDPPGNNGFVKIEDENIDDIPQNDPHVGCVFNVEFYNYDQGAYTATVTFEAQAPTAGPVGVTGNLKPFIGEDAAGGGKDLDARETYTLAFTGAPHPQQGFHVKLTIHAEGSIGADVKHKVFWVEGCGTTPTPTETPTGTPTETPTSTPTETPTGTPTETPTETPTGTPTETPTGTPTGTPTETPTGTPTETPTGTPTETPTGTPTQTPTGTPTQTPTGTPTETPTGTPTQTPTGTPTGTPTETPTGTPTGTPTSPPSETPSTSPTTGTSSATTGVPSTPVSVPTEVEAGLAGPVAQDDSTRGRTVFGAGLLAAGGIMIGMGAFLVLRRRARGLHQV